MKLFTYESKVIKYRNENLTGRCNFNQRSLSVRGYGAWQMLSEFPDKSWKWGSVDTLLKKIGRTGTIDRQPGTTSLKCGMICSRLSLTRLSASGDSDWGRVCSGTTFWALIMSLSDRYLDWKNSPMCK